MSEIPAKATESEDPSDGAMTRSTGEGSAEGAPPVDAMWQSNPPGSIYDYIRVASFSIGPDGHVDQWSLRAEQLFGIPAERAVGMDPIDAFIDSDLREQGQRKMAEILDGREWTGVVPFRLPVPPDRAPGDYGDHGHGGAAHAPGGTALDRIG
ncbi:PAS domain S-box protein, partial [Streptomyces sp. NPDC007070]|uniref:PAS domain S-box protein n=1 Tax=Streptomyces sp. NPDC007070 TaxID=3154312 RepID=UPI0033EC8DB6